jgi:hypothetical protein
MFESQCSAKVPGVGGYTRALAPTWLTLDNMAVARQQRDMSLPSRLTSCGTLHYRHSSRSMFSHVNDLSSLRQGQPRLLVSATSYGSTQRGTGQHVALIVALSRRMGSYTQGFEPKRCLKTPSPRTTRGTPIVKCLPRARADDFADVRSDERRFSITTLRNDRRAISRGSTPGLAIA